jgi:LmbE family N-acetylglucosaminyl deacetylase
VRAFSTVPVVALAVYAHPDDADVAAGGSLAAWARAGAETHLIIVCDGAKGSHDADASIELLRAQRADELASAAKLLSVTSVECLQYRDGEFSNDVHLRATLVGAIRRLRPDVVCGPDPTATFFDGVYVNHRDHRETGWALLDAVAPASSMPLYFPEAGDAHGVSHLLLSGTHDPDVVVDVADSVHDKVNAVLAHSSQLSDDPEWVRSIIMGRAQHTGREIGVAYGEAFRHVSFAH